MTNCFPSPASFSWWRHWNSSNNQVWQTLMHIPLLSVSTTESTLESLLLNCLIPFVWANDIILMYFTASCWLSASSNVLPHNIPKCNLIVLHLAICCKSLYRCGQESDCGYMWTWRKGRPSHHFRLSAVLLISSHTALLVNGIFVFLSLIFLCFFLFKWELPWDGWRDKWNERQKRRMKRSWLFVKVVYKWKSCQYFDHYKEQRILSMRPKWTNYINRES